MRLTNLKKYFDYQTILICSYTAIFVLAPILSNKMIDVIGMKFLIGSLIMTAGFGIIDVLNNNYGKATAIQAVVSAFVVRSILYPLMVLFVLIPPFKQPEGFNTIILDSFRLFVAGEISITISQLFIDIPVFDYMKRNFGGFWARYNVSNLISSLIGIVVFMVIGFAGTDSPVFTLIWSKYLVRVVISLVLTPLFSSLNRLVCQKQS